MLRTILKSKIHRATVSETNLEYEGSITIDSALLRAADILPYEIVHVLDINNGARFETYAISGRSGEICVNGAAARLVSSGDCVIILSYVQATDDEARGLTPLIVRVDTRNVIVQSVAKPDLPPVGEPDGGNQ